MPLTNRVDVDVLLTFAFAALAPPFVKVVFMLLMEVKPPGAPEKNSSIILPPKLNPNGVKMCEVSAVECGWWWWWW